MSTTFLKYFDSISDPRIDCCKKHNLLDILLLSITPVMSGSEGWEDIENFGHIKLDWLRQYRDFEAGIPRHDTIARVISRLKASEIEQAFQSWISSLIKKQVAMLSPLMAKQRVAHLPLKAERMHCTQSVLGVVSIN